MSLACGRTKRMALHYTNLRQTIHVHLEMRCEENQLLCPTWFNKNWKKLYPSDSYRSKSPNLCFLTVHNKFRHLRQQLPDSAIEARCHSNHIGNYSHHLQFRRSKMFKDTAIKKSETIKDHLIECFHGIAFCSKGIVQAGHESGGFIRK